MKVLIAEDNPSMRTLLRRIFDRNKFTVTVCANGKEAIEELNKCYYEIILTDWMMPIVDGIELIKYIREKISPPPIIIMVTALASRSAQNKALLAGADEYITKPYKESDILLKIENLLLQQGKRDSIKIPEILDVTPKINSFYGVAIAASTGGPQALLQFFSLLPKVYKAAFFVVLHAPAWMLASFSDRLQKECKVKVKLAEEGMAIVPGEVYLAPGGLHLSIHPSTKNITLLDTPPENFVKPAADPTFKIVAEIFGKNSIGVVLTGMGHDGSIGSGYIKAAGGLVIAQDPKEAMLSSMPQSVVDLKLASVITKLIEIPALIANYIKK
ncbi:MAG TPA: chemotaxis protein CheB [Melioribacteraceae bacterium]|nr:chemotaxis protein CheB [Melioribacteraceae bacterium]